VVVRANGLSAEGRAYLERLYPGRVQEVTDAQLLQLGMTPWTQHVR
jgi:hypothetical protein